ncbi:DUF2076 domain-containing protein [Buchnera aphidicola]|uniref:DUF2076 domain-containing protein n=1 Tax=Buchnera aphidicola TaxID=9 RepID=UPI0020921E13|nr:DUF2076 domain-containing protein [Buchnera aphidicola]USS94258.1 DUF2076 domain-containing protein [Buchnera aphidicola (Sipha maydis)]
MDNKEKKLIEELFSRLRKAENTSSNRDENAEKFIYHCYAKQKNSIYYMIQTILVQEVAIKKLNQIIDHLKKNKSNTTTKKTFLSGLLEKYMPYQKEESKILKNNNPINNTYSENKSSESSSSPMNNNTFSTPSSSSHGSFLGNALQTAAGVAGGMVAGNMLMNLFSGQHRPEDEILHSAHEHYFPVHDSHDINNVYVNDDLHKSEDFHKTGNTLSDSDDVFHDDISNHDGNFLENNHYHGTNNESILDDFDDDDY